MSKKTYNVDIQYVAANNTLPEPWISAAQQSLFSKTKPCKDIINKAIIKLVTSHNPVDQFYGSYLFHDTLVGVNVNSPFGEINITPDLLRFNFNPLYVCGQTILLVPLNSAEGYLIKVEPANLDSLKALIKHELGHIIHLHPLAIKEFFSYYELNEYNKTKLNIILDMFINGCYDKPTIPHLPTGCIYSNTPIGDLQPKSFFDKDIEDLPFIAQTMSSFKETFLSRAGWNLIQPVPEQDLALFLQIYTGKDSWRSLPKNMEYLYQVDTIYFEVEDKAGSAEQNQSLITPHNYDKTISPETCRLNVLQVVEKLKGLLGEDKIPEELLQAIITLHKSIVPWTTILRAQLGEFYGGQRLTYTRPHRRRQEFGIKGKTRYGLFPLIISVDTSASINDYQLEQFFSELESLVKDNIIYCVTHSIDPKPLIIAGNPTNQYTKGDWKQIEIAERGGTDFIPVTKYMINKFSPIVHSCRTKVPVIYLTDGIGSWPKTPPFGDKAKYFCINISDRIPELPEWLTLININIPKGA